jgi:hypothetical protein
MSLKRSELYRLPWSRVDNPGGWIEPTDVCDLACPGCFRRRLTGHRPLAELEAEILELSTLVNSDRIAIAGGEPLLYPQIDDLVAFIARRGLKPMILSNGTHLTAERARELKAAGLHTLYLHVDSGQDRPGWKNASEAAMNPLRQRYADLLAEVGGIQCGFNVTVTRRTLPEVPEVVAWSLANIRTVQHLSLIALRALPLDDTTAYQVDGTMLEDERVPNSCTDRDAISITTDEIYSLIEARFPSLVPGGYLGGSAWQETNKFLIIAAVGGGGACYGVLGAKTMELWQVWHHLTRRRYVACGPGPIPAAALAALAIVDPSARRALARLALAALARPWRWLRRLHVQTINLQQPVEVLRGEMNLCDGCVNMMMYRGELIPSCRLDEYRLFGSPLVPVPREGWPGVLGRDDSYDPRRSALRVRATSRSAPVL